MSNKPTQNISLPFLGIKSAIFKSQDHFFDHQAVVTLSSFACINQYICNLSKYCYVVGSVSGFLLLCQFTNVQFSFTFSLTVLTAHESLEQRNTVQKCLNYAAFQIKWRRCIIHLWRIPCERGPAGKQEVSEGFSLLDTQLLVKTPSPAVGT